MQLSHDGKEILAIVMGIENVLIFGALKPFLIEIGCKRIHGFMKKNLLNMQV